MSDALTIIDNNRLEQIAVEIETIQGVALLKVGERLLEAQELFKYQRDEQGFGGWVDSRLRFGQTTAYKLISVFTAFGAESVHKVDTLPKSVLYALAEPSTPASLRDKALDMVKPGKPVSEDDIAALKRELAEAKKLAKDAKRDEKVQRDLARKALEDRAKMLRDYEWAKSTADARGQEIERLKQDGVIHVYPSVQRQQSLEDHSANELEPQPVTDEEPAISGYSARAANDIARFIQAQLPDRALQRVMELLDWTTAREIAEALRALRDEEAA